MSKYLKNFGVGLGLSPYKETEDDEKPKVNVKEYGNDGKKADKLGTKIAKGAVTVLSHALASVYGGTAHTPKINWGKRKKEIKAPEVAENIIKGTKPEGENKSTDKPENAEMNFGSRAEGNEFRAWVNKNYPEEAKKIGKTGLDPEGSHTNSYIKEAWSRFGQEFNKSKSDSPAKMSSPTKARQSSRGGKRARRATRTAKRRGGFAKSKGKRGAGGRNVGGYNVQTRFSPRAAQPIKGGVTSGGGGGGQPYSFDKNGDMIFSPTINNIIGGDGGTQTQTQTQSQTQDMEWVPPQYGERTITGKLPTYREAWDKNNKNVQSKYATFEDFEKAAIAWNKKHGGGGSTSRTERYLISEGYYRPTGGTSTQTQTQTQTSGLKMRSGKFKLGGYRTMHGK